MIKTALIIVDVQNDFASPAGALAVNDGADVVDVINALRNNMRFDRVVLTQDWHPPGHVSFHSSHSLNPAAKLFRSLDLGNGKIQMMWPDHCIQGSNGADFHPKLQLASDDKIVQKGVDINIDSYSGFMDNDRHSKTELYEFLQGIHRVVVVGLAFDYCVGSTALDAKAAGFDVIVCTDGTKSVAPDSKKDMERRLNESGIRCITTSEYSRRFRD